MLSDSRVHHYPGISGIQLANPHVGFVITPLQGVHSGRAVTAEGEGLSEGEEQSEELRSYP